MMRFQLVYFRSPRKSFSTEVWFLFMVLVPSCNVLLFYRLGDSIRQDVHAPGVFVPTFYALRFWLPSLPSLVFKCQYQPINLGDREFLTMSLVSLWTYLSQSFYIFLSWCGILLSQIIRKYLVVQVFSSCVRFLGCLVYGSLRCRTRCFYWSCLNFIDFNTFNTKDCFYLNLMCIFLSLLLYKFIV